MTLTWLILYLSTYKEIQEKLRKEIKSGVGLHTLPSFQDTYKIPYTEAIISETLRHSSITPFGLFHTATKDVDFHGYKIPKGSQVASFLWGIHHDSKIWKDNPMKFIPERFINVESGEYQKPSEGFLPFSIGKRSCVGENVARNNLFLVVTSIYQRFITRCEHDGGELGLEPLFSVMLMPKPFRVSFEKIKN